MTDLTDAVDDLPADPGTSDPADPGTSDGESLDRSRPRLLVALAGSLLAVVAIVLVVAWIAVGGDEAEPVEALPISDDIPVVAVAPPRPPTTLEPVVEVEEPTLVGELVATAKLTQGEVAVWASPDDDEPSWRLPVPTEFWGDRHFLVIDQIDDWYKILVPVRPNETEGWIPADAVTLSATNFRVQISVSEKTVRVWEGDELIIDTTSAVGRENAPTPLGNFYIRDVLPWDEASAYGPYVLALSAYSEAIDQINGGDAVVAIHGTSRPELIGRAVSLGCIRLHNEDITLLAETVPVGTPVEIVA